MRVPHPIPYQGSKRNLAERILGFFPRDFDRVVEPFAGSAAISLASGVRWRNLAFLLNDAHGPVAGLWRAILDSPHELADGYSRLWHEQLGRERRYYDIVRDRFNETHQPADFLYLLARCVKAAIRYNTAGHFNNSPDNRRRGARPEVMRQRILGAWSVLSGRTKVENMDYTEVLSACSHNDLVYMDPPYRGVCLKRDSRYAPTVDHEQFMDVLASMNTRGFSFIVSYDGRTDEKVYAESIPREIGLEHFELPAGRSTQATLLGRSSMTFESLYLSRAVADRLVDEPARCGAMQPLLFTGH